MEYTAKNSRQYHVSKIMWLDWSKTAKQFSVNLRGQFFCQYQASRRAGKQVSRQASARPEAFLSQNFRYIPAFKVVYVVKYTVLFVFGKCLMDSEQVIFIFTEVWPYNFHGSR